ncbi:hypothetical protein Skr01_36660 [Sphaerisporangium krabiense]|uniref:Uncharacterized protein n=1 Tax=Sphaerisporangium krabiense TaxID=763782 RepID=A0A7W9DPP1_9ACTN|nr:hypothetical protein [Sphaerisporangium krabiense]MBB5626661.1 hypothetical protein [Sphaerisporangium krabiense]GII63581.1 hypothetical protein Skr01_36660 [Sphaerisporangium krabiense]
MSTPTITPQSVLRRAAELIQANGRNRETYLDFAQHEDDGVPVDRCRMCTAGALGFAAGADVTTCMPFLEETGPLAVEAGRALIGHLGLNFSPEPLSAETVISIIGHWNDAEDRTDQQVIDALNATADDLDAEEAA